jgi:chemotaxis protein MotA
MDKLTFLGLFIAIVAIFGGQILEGGSVSALIDASAFVIVVGGSAGAVLVQSHAKTFKRAMQILTWAFKSPVQPVEEGVSNITAWSTLARREGLLGLERNIGQVTDLFILKGLGLLIDGNDPDVIRKSMYVELDVKDNELLSAAKVFESMGGYSPTLGIVGAVLGLIHVMGNLSNPELLGSGIATAFVATIYGVGFANLFYLPIYHKLRAVIAAQSQYREMIIEGLACIAAGENPRVIEGKLNGYIA